MKDSGGTSGKAIKVYPEELIFDQVGVNQQYTQQLVLKNNLSATVELTLKASNSEKIDIEPKYKKLAPFESFNVDITVKIIKSLPQKTQKQKETIFIKSDFFDQKVNVTLIPSLTQSTTPRDTSLGSSIRYVNQEKVNKNMISRRDSSKDGQISLNFMSKEQELPSHNISNNDELQKQIEIKNQQISQFNNQLKEYEVELQNTYENLHVEQAKRKEIEEKYNDIYLNSNKEYMDDIKKVLKEREPNLEVLMDLTMKKEREQQEKKDAKILDILKIKDKQIQDIQQKQVAQETDYGHLAQSYQEAKRRIKFLEDESEKNNDIIKQLHNQLEMLQNKFISFQNGDEYQRMGQLEEQLNQALQEIDKLQEQNNISEYNLQEQNQKESYFQEIINRMREQVNQKDEKYLNTEKNLQDEKERRIREEEHVKSLMQQINQINQENINERSLNLDKIRSDKDLIETITKLQNEKYELLNDIDQLRKQILSDQDRLRMILDRLSQIRGFGFQSTNNFGYQQQIIELIGRKVEDVARVLKEMEEDNIDINQKLKKQNDLISSREKELEQIMFENEELSLKANIKKKNQGIQVQINSKENNETQINFDQMKQSTNDLEYKNTKLEEQLQQYKQKYKQMQSELDNTNQELSYHIKNQQQRKHSPSTQSAITQYGGKQDQEEVVSRLNAKLTNMKFNEEKLQQEIHQLRSQQQSQHMISSSIKNSSMQSQSQLEQSENQKYLSLEERLGEYEFIILDQRQKLINLEQNNSDFIQKLQDMQFQHQNEIELNEQKIKRLCEINAKYEQINLQQSFYNQEGYGLQSKFQSEEGAYSQSTKSTAANTERMRQFVQQLELNNLALKHDLDEQKLQKEQAKKEQEQLKQDINLKNKELIFMKQTYKLSNLNMDSQNEINKFVSKIQDQKQKIIQLESLIEQQSSNTKQNEFDKNLHIDKKSWTGQRIEDLYKTNENLRHENQQQILAFQEVKEEYVNKISDISEKYELDRQKLKNENISNQRKLETLQSQMQYMEKKEIRLFGQLEESKLQQLQESQEKEKRTIELEELLFKKEEIINELEREIKQKEKSLQERQEQIAVLIETLENEHSTEQLRQKVLNLSAELCSLKAIEAQQERKANELFHSLKKAEMLNQKGLKQHEQEKLKSNEYSKQIKQIQDENEELNKQIQELHSQLNDAQRECSEFKYKSERESFQIKLKDESINQFKDQIRRYEISFKNEIDKIKKDFCEKITQQQSNTIIDTNVISKNLSFKQCLNQLNLILSDLFEKGFPQSEQIIIQELEKALMIASQNIEKLQDEIYKENKLNCKLQNEYRALAHNKILICQHEIYIARIQTLQSLINQREEDKQIYQKEKDMKYQKIIREQEIKIQYLQKELNESQEQNSEMIIDLQELKINKEEIEQELVSFQQELQNQKQSMEKQAELQVEERFKSKFEIIRTYFDSSITKILLGSGNQDKVLELGREICSLKIVINKLEQKLIYEQTNKEASQINVQYFKELNQQFMQKIRDIQTKNNQLQLKVQNQNQIQKLELEKKKQDNLQLEKDIIKCKDQIEQLQREVMKYEEQIIQQKEDKQSRQSLQQKNNDQYLIEQEKIVELNQTIQVLQEQLIEVRSQHIQEYEDLKNQYDLELSEGKREIIKEKQVLEKRYSPGQAPGDLVDQNEKMRQKLIEIRQSYEQVTQENIIIRKKLEQEKIQVETQKNSIYAHKKALADLETTLMDGSTQQYINNQSSQYQQFQKQKPEEQKRKSTGQKQGKNSKHQLHFNKDLQYSEDQQSHSKILQQESSSLDVSALTSMNLVNQRNSNYNNAGGSQWNNSNNKQFIVNPPQLVKALINSKINETINLKKVEEALIKENQLREQNKNLLLEKQQYLQLQGQNVRQQERVEEYDEIYNKEQKKRIIELEIENEELGLQKSQTLLYENQKSLYNRNDIQQESQNKIEYPQQDCNLLIESVLLLTNKLACLETQNKNYENSNQQSENQYIEQAQRLVIKSLTNIISDNKGQIDLKYLPTSESDRKIWYLELLEQQLDNSDSIIKNLQGFIKKLQIEIQGNLQSAAQIKAASMDLAQNTKQTSEEILIMRQVLGLIKHDLISIKNSKKTIQKEEFKNTYNKTINPFNNNIDQNTLNFQGAQNEELIQNIEALQNQLTLTEKVKKSLENELVQLKMNQAQEIQQISFQFKQAKDQRDSLLQTNEELHNKVNQLDTILETLKKEIQNTNNQSSYNMSILLEKEREKDTLAKNKVTTQKHLNKLQQDLHDWRKQSEENMKIKDKQIQELTQSQNNLQIERDRLKSENQMLRKNEKQRQKGQQDDIKRIEQDNKDLQDQLNKQIQERKNEIEYWVTERATMREMIDQLEIQKAGNDNEKIEIYDKIDVKNMNSDQLKQLKKKSHKKIKQKEIEIKNKDKELQALKDELLKVKLSTTSLEYKIRDAGLKCGEAEERVKYFQQKFKEAELEKELVLAEKNNAISSNDIGAIQIQQELNSLRECFAKLKVERDNLLYEIDNTQSRDIEWKHTVEILNEEMQTMEKHLIGREKEASNQLKILEAKQGALIQDVKYFRQDNEKLKIRIKDYELQDNENQRNIHQIEMNSQQQRFQNEEVVKQTNEIRQQMERKEQQYKDIQEQLILNEGIKYKEIEELRNKLNEVKDANAQIIVLYENQLEFLKTKFVQENKKSDQKIDQMFSLAQREAVIKSLKKEVSTFKVQLNKQKHKNKDLKQSLQNNQENLSQSQTNNKQQHSQMMSSYARNSSKLNNKGLLQKSSEEQQIDKQTQKVAQFLMSEGGIRELLQQLQNQNKYILKLAQLEADYSKSENWNMVLSQQLQQQQENNNQLVLELEQLQKKTSKEQKSIKQSQISNSEVKILQQEIDQIKQEWLSPQDSNLLQQQKEQLLEQVKEQSLQIKSLKDELQRKREVLTQMKQQRDQTEVEANQIISDMEGLKDDNVKLQKLIKDNAKQQQSMKDLKSKNDFLKNQEKIIKDELNQLNEKNKVNKIDLQRKEQLIREMNNKINTMQDEVNLCKEKQNEIERCKDFIKKQKLEIEIKDNQVKSLKQRLDITDNELEQVKTLNQSSIQNSQNTQHQIESQVKIGKNKLKKYENYLKKSLEALRKIGKELTNKQGQIVIKDKRRSQKSLKSDNPMIISELEKDMYKDSVNILGVSIDELEEFMNPQAVHNQSSVINKSLNQTFMAKLDQVCVEIPDSLNSDLDQICNYCMKLIQDLNPDINFL